MSHLIFFVAVVLATALAASALTSYVKSVQASSDVRTSMEIERIQSSLTFVDGSGDVNYLWFYVRNSGKTSMVLEEFDVFVEGRYVTSCPTGCREIGDGDGVLEPGEILEVNVLYPGSGSFRVKVTGKYGVSAEGVVVR